MRLANFKHKFKFFLIVVLLLHSKVNAQISDSLQIKIGTTATGASKNYQPFWIVSNRSATITDQKTDLSTHVQVSNTYKHFSNAQQNIKQEIKKRSYFLNYGIDIYNYNHFKKIIINEAFLKTGFKAWEIRGGRYEETLGEVDLELSSGSFGVSKNALPIPKIGIVLPYYIDVPFTNGWLQLKGQFSHGWLGNTNYLKGAFLHQKSFYLKAGRNKLQFYGGLNHFAQWGGSHPLGQAPSRFKDYLRIIIGAKGNGSDPIYQQGPIDIANAVGNHMLIPDLGLILKNKASILRFYTQTIFEKGVADSANQRDKLAGLKLLSRDRLVGLSWETSNKSLIQKLVIEGIFTKYQGGPIIFRGRDNYYNNATYQTGWEYKGRIIGTPLFINRLNAENYKLNTDVSSISSWNIVSNRIKGVHLGLKGSIFKRLNFRTLITYVQHYGNYYNNTAFTPYKWQLHLLYESTYPINKAFSLTAAIGKDYGNLSKISGALVKLEWNLSR